jgi:hypothetical protein
MGYDQWKATDTLGDELDGESRQDQRLDEEARDLRWQAFMDWARCAHFNYLLFICSVHVGKSASEIRDIFEADYWPLADMITDHGWSGVLQALAQIQKERETKAA